MPLESLDTQDVALADAQWQARVVSPPRTASQSCTDSMRVSSTT